MSTLQLSCPICDCRRQLPVGVADQMTRCSACDATFQVADESLGTEPRLVVATIDANLESNPLVGLIKWSFAQDPAQSFAIW